MGGVCRPLCVARALPLASSRLPRTHQWRSLWGPGGRGLGLVISMVAGHSQANPIHMSFNSVYRIRTECLQQGAQA